MWGETAFTHKAGQHVDVLVKAEHLMEHMDSALVGNSRKILLSELAGKSTIVRKLSKYGDYDKGSKIVSALTKTLKKKEMEGYEYEAAEASFACDHTESPGKIHAPFRAEELPSGVLQNHGEQKQDRRPSLPERRRGSNIWGAAVGEGPVDTLYASIRDALIPSYPFLKNIHLIDYRVRVLNPEEATAAKVRVFISFTDGHINWDSVGVSENIIEASWEGLIDAVNYFYNNVILED